VTVTDEYVAALRAYLTGDPTAFDAISGRLAERDGDEGGNTFGALLGMAFVVAARRRFAAGYTDGDIVQVVAQARAAFAGRSDGIDPLAAERMLRAVLGGVPAEGVDERVKAVVIPALLLELTNQEQLRGHTLDAYLAETRALTERVQAGLR